MKWSPALVADLRKLAAERCTSVEAAKLIGQTPASVKSASQRYRIAWDRREPPPPRDHAAYLAREIAAARAEAADAPPYRSSIGWPA